MRGCSGHSRAVGVPEKILQLMEALVTKWETVFEVGGLDCEIHTGRVKYNRGRGIQGRRTFPAPFHFDNIVESPCGEVTGLSLIYCTWTI